MGIEAPVCKDCECYCLLLDEHGIDWTEIGDTPDDSAVTKGTAGKASRNLQAAITDVLQGVGFTSSGIPSGSIASQMINPEDTSAYGAYLVAGLNALGSAAVEWTRKFGFKTGSLVVEELVEKAVELAVWAPLLRCCPSGQIIVSA